MRQHGVPDRPPFRPDWQCVKFTDVQCRQDFPIVPGMAETERKQQAQRRLVRLLQKHNSIVVATADLQNHIPTLLIVVKQQVYRPALEIGLQTMGRTSAVRAFLTEFLDHALLLKHPLVLAIKQGTIKLPSPKTPEMDRSMYSLQVLKKSVWATIHQNIELHDAYREHCRVVESLLELLTHNPHGMYGLPGQLLPLFSIPKHQLPCSIEAARAWRAEVKRLSPLFLFRDPSQMTRADLGPVEVSCCCTISDTLRSDWQLLLEAAPAPCSMQSQCSSGTASADDDICDDSSGCASMSAATRCVSSPVSQQPSSAASIQPRTPTPPPQ